MRVCRTIGTILREMTTRITAMLLLLLMVAACSHEKSPEDAYLRGAELEKASRNKRVARTFEQFISSPTYNQSRDMWRGAAIQDYNPRKSRVLILLKEQRGRLYINDRIAMDFPICSGRVGGHETPRGTFRITEKKREHRSSSYGSFVDANNVVVQGDAKSWQRAPKGTHFKGASMPYWMRFNGAVGMHVGSVYRSGASHGCVRVPPEACSILFEKLAVGSAVIVK